MFLEFLIDDIIVEGFDLVLMPQFLLGQELEQVSDNLAHGYASQEIVEFVGILLALHGENQHLLKGSIFIEGLKHQVVGQLQVLDPPGFLHGANLREMQEFMSHASLTTYTHVAKSGLHDAVAFLAEMPVDQLDRQQRG